MCVLISYRVTREADRLWPDVSEVDRGDEQAAFWSTIADKYDRVVDASIGGKSRAMLRELLAKEGPLGKSVVEFGCGTGFFTETLASKSETLLATDLSRGMLDLARRRVKATNVSFQVEDCQQTSLPDNAFDAAFVSLVLHFTEPRRALAEMHRILRSGGMLIITNLDPLALTGFDRTRSRLRVLYHGIVDYRVRPPKGFGRNVLSENRLRESLVNAGFRVERCEPVKDRSRSSFIPVEYVCAVKGV